MSDKEDQTNEPVQQSAAEQQAVHFDPLDAHLMRRAKFFENEALMLALNLRDALTIAQKTEPPPSDD